jgi:hypothetical protein
MRCACRRLVLGPWCASALVAVQQPPSWPGSAFWLRQSFLPARPCCKAQAPAQPPPVRRAGQELLPLRIDVRERLGDPLLLVGDPVQCRHSYGRRRAWPCNSGTSTSRPETTAEGPEVLHRHFRRDREAGNPGHVHAEPGELVAPVFGCNGTKIVLRERPLTWYDMVNERKMSARRDDSEGVHPQAT